MAPLVSVAAVLITYIAVSSPTHRAAVLSFFAGVIAYFAIAHFIQMGFYAWDEVDTWWTFTEPMWVSMHGGDEAPHSSTINGYERKDYLSFVIATHLIIAIVLSAITAWTVHVIAHRRTG
jgi:hypothetical protein